MDVVRQKLDGFYRLPEIVGDRKKGRPGLLPVSKSSWWLGVASGRYPASVKLGPRTTAWRVQDVNSLIERLGQTAEVGK